MVNQEGLQQQWGSEPSLSHRAGTDSQKLVDRTETDQAGNEEKNADPAPGGLGSHKDKRDQGKPHDDSKHSVQGVLVDFHLSLLSR